MWKPDINIDENLNELNLTSQDDFDTSQYWNTRDQREQDSLKERILHLSRNGPSEALTSILRKEELREEKLNENDAETGLYSIDLNFVDSSGWTPLIHACFNGFYDIASEILNYQEKKYKYDFGENESMENEEDKEEIIKYKYYFISFVCRKVKWNGSTAFHLSCARGHDIIVKLLINKMLYSQTYNIKSKQLIDATDYDLATPLHCAVLGKHLNVVKILLNNNAKIKRDIRGKTPIDWAKQRNLTNFIQLLQDKDNRDNKARNTVDSIWENNNNQLCISPQSTQENSKVKLSILQENNVLSPSPDAALSIGNNSFGISSDCGSAELIVSPNPPNQNEPQFTFNNDRQNPPNPPNAYPNTYNNNGNNMNPWSIHTQIPPPGPPPTQQLSGNFDNNNDNNCNNWNGHCSNNRNNNQRQRAPRHIRYEQEQQQLRRYNDNCNVNGGWNVNYNNQGWYNNNNGGHQEWYNPYGFHNNYDQFQQNQVQRTRSFSPTLTNISNNDNNNTNIPSLSVSKSFDLADCRDNNLFHVPSKIIISNKNPSKVEVITEGVQTEGISQIKEEVHHDTEGVKVKEREIGKEIEKEEENVVVDIKKSIDSDDIKDHEFVEENKKDNNNKYDLIKIENEQLLSKCKSLQKMKCDMMNKYEKEINDNKNKWELKENKFLQQIDTKQKQILELQHTMKRMRQFLDSLPIRVRRNFYRHGNNQNNGNHHNDKCKDNEQAINQSKSKKNENMTNNDASNNDNSSKQNNKNKYIVFEKNKENVSGSNNKRKHRKRHERIYVNYKRRGGTDDLWKRKR